MCHVPFGNERAARDQLVAGEEIAPRQKPPLSQDAREEKIKGAKRRETARERRRPLNGEREYPAPARVGHALVTKP